MAETTNKQIVRDALAAIFDRFDAVAVERLLTEDYVQHNPLVPSGRAPIVGVLPALRESGITIETHRLLAEGPYVVAHNSYTNASLFGGEHLVAFDVFRIENGRVAEHWDNIAARSPANPSGRTQVDGPVTVTDLDLTAANKTIVQDFLNSVLIGGQVERAASFIDAAGYHQHNSAIADGLDGLAAALEAMARQGIHMEYHTIHLVVAEGSFVFAMSEGTLGRRPTAFFDLFRLENGKIVEHWDVVAPIPERMAHPNGKFRAAVATV